MRIKARRAIVLAAGGFEYNQEMKREYLAGYPIYAYGHDGNRGDGVKLAQTIGADLWHMKAVAAPMGFKFAEHDAAFIMRMPADGYIIVDQNGRRFCNETGLEHYSMWMAVTVFDMEALRYTRIPSYVIFDEGTRRAGPITSAGHGANRSYQWSKDNQAEVERGWIKTGNDARSLAIGLGMPRPDDLEATLSQYQEFCRAGEDRAQGRSAQSMLELRPPFYAVPLWPSLLNTQGGPRRNSRGQVLDVWGKPVGRLYAAGELGSVWGGLYQSGGNLGECLGLGRMAGLHAAAEQPYDRPIAE